MEISQNASDGYFTVTIIIICLFILTANWFLPGGSGTTVRYVT
jgi:hypothetical protein